MKTPNDYFGGSSSGNNYPASFSREKPSHQHLSSKSNDQLADHVNNNNNNNHNNSEPIYSEPFPPDQNELNSSGSGQSPLLVSNGSKNHHGIKFFPDPHDPVQISNHIYEYLVSKRVAEERRSQDNLINAKRRGSLSSSPSDGSSTNNSKQPDFSSGKRIFFFVLIYLSVGIFFSSLKKKNSCEIAICILCTLLEGDA